MGLFSFDKKENFIRNNIIRKPKKKRADVVLVYPIWVRRALKHRVHGKRGSIFDVVFENHIMGAYVPVFDHHIKGFIGTFVQGREVQ